MSPLNAATAHNYSKFMHEIAGMRKTGTSGKCSLYMDLKSVPEQRERTTAFCVIGSIYESVTQKHTGGHH